MLIMYDLFFYNFFILIKTISHSLIMVSSNESLNSGNISSILHNSHGIGLKDLDVSIDDQQNLSYDVPTKQE